MNREDIFAIRELLLRMRIAANNKEVDRLSGEIMTLVRGDMILPQITPPDVTWEGNTMVVR